jgi:uncharacterized membrane protein
MAANSIFFIAQLPSGATSRNEITSPSRRFLSVLGRLGASLRRTYGRFVRTLPYHWKNVMKEDGVTMAEHRNTCAVCGQTKPASQTIPAALVQPNIDALIRAKKPDWSNEDFICTICLNRFRTEFVREQMEKDRGELSSLEQEVIKSIHDDQFVADNLNKEFEKKLGFGDRLADKVAAFGGSWKFIILFFTVMAVWIVANSVYFLWHPWDQYPFILFNLILSMLAAIQAPIIMMSQNRQESRDRLRAENDYQVNLKAEIEIRALGDKVDQLLHNQWMRLLEIQQMQTEMLEDLVDRAKK